MDEIGRKRQLGGGNQGRRHGSAYGAGKLLQRIADGIPVRFHGFIQHGQTVGEDISYGQPLAGGEEEVAPHKHPGGSEGKGTVEQDKGENQEDTSQKHRLFGAEAVINPT